MYEPFYAEQQKQQARKRLATAEAKLQSMAEREEAAQEALAAYLERSGNDADQLRLLEYFSSFGKDSSSQAVPKIIVDPAYQALSEDFYGELIQVRAARQQVAQIEAAVQATEFEVEVLLPAALPDEPSSPDAKKAVLFVLFAFFVGFGGWLMLAVGRKAVKGAVANS